MSIIQKASVLDACALIAFFSDEPGAGVMEEMLTDPARANIVHAINLCEMYYHYRRQNGEATAEDAAETFAVLNVAVHEDMDAVFWREIARLKTTFTLSLGDCCGLALALRLGAPFVTSDHHEFDAVAASGLIPILFIR